MTLRRKRKRKGQIADSPTNEDIKEELRKRAQRLLKELAYHYKLIELYDREIEKIDSRLYPGKKKRKRVSDIPILFLQRTTLKDN